MKDVNCPYCGHEIDLEHDFIEPFEEDEIHQYECGSCEKTFIYGVNIEITYNAEPADCLNDGQHEMKKFASGRSWYPDAKRCAICGLEEIGEMDQAEFDRIFK